MFFGGMGLEVYRELEKGVGVSFGVVVWLELQADEGGGDIHIHIYKEDRT